MSTHTLHQYFIHAAQQYPDHIAVVEPDAGSITYRALADLSDRMRDYLYHANVRRGDRVGICMRKSIDTVAAILGILKAGAAYVPVDPGAPSSRNAFIMHNCEIRLAIIEQRFETALTEELQKLGSPLNALVLDSVGGGVHLDQSIRQTALQPQQSGVIETATPAPDDLAYILYTSGSTGKPKGVMLTHKNATSFVDWCSEVFQPAETDRFSSHAPFHFDLSVLDIHVTLKHGATLVLISEETGKDPGRLAPVIARQKITCWYSAPSILSLLAQYGNLANHDYSALRLVLFAGEVFPVKHLRSLTTLLPHPKYFNLYGPTETNVCTFHEIPLPVPEARDHPFPIGRVCSHLDGKVIDENSHTVTSGQAGELCISGSNVMAGYWALPEQTNRAFIMENGQRWYRTGDIVTQTEDGSYIYQGRRDRMVKRRGYRVELGEIEAGLYRHPLIKEAAIIAVSDTEAVIRIKACLVCHEAKHPSIIEMKRFCSENMPVYMIPDEFVWHNMLPKTSTDKIDYQRLKEPH